MSSKRLHLEGMKNSQTSNNPLRQWAKISKRPFTKEMAKKHMKRCAKPFAMGSGAGKATRTSLRAYLNGPRLTKYMEKAPHVTKGRIVVTLLMGLRNGSILLENNLAA